MQEEEEDKTPKAWFVRHEGLPVGPLPGAKIRGLLLDGELTLADQISVDRKHWTRICDVPEVVPVQIRADAGDSDALAVLSARERLDANENARERRFPLHQLLIVVFLLTGVIGLALWVGMPQEVESPQCSADPAQSYNAQRHLVQFRHVEMRGRGV